MNLRLPTWASVALSALAGVLEGLNVTVFGFATPWQQLVTVGLAALAVLGISPLTGPALETALHISHKTALALATLISTLIVAVTTLGISQSAKGIIVGVLSLLAGTLFGTPQPAPVPTPTPMPAPAAK